MKAQINRSIKVNILENSKHIFLNIKNKIPLKPIKNKKKTSF